MFAKSIQFWGFFGPPQTQPFIRLALVKEEEYFVFKILILTGPSDADYQKGWVSGSNVRKFFIGSIRCGFF